MIICPAIVPTAELDSPDASSAVRNDARRAGAEQRRQRRIGGLDFGDVAVALVERARRHHHHRHIDQTGDRQSDDDLDVGEAQQLAALAVVARRRAILRQAGMQEDGVRHDRRADDADRDRQGAGVGKLRRDRTEARRAPIDRRDEHFDEIAKRDGGDQGADDQSRSDGTLVLRTSECRRSEPP